MVDSSRLRKKLSKVLPAVGNAMRDQIEKEATALVKEMRLYLSVTWPRVTRKVEIDWTWGDLPAGVTRLRTVRSREFNEVSVTIYARGLKGSGISPAWFEFGTSQRVQKKTGRRTGAVPAGPYFFPAYRSNKQRIRNNIRGAVRRAVKKVSK